MDDVVARAEGNAFYAEELLAAGLHGEALPLGLTDVLLARVEQRSPAAQQVLRIAAVAGRRVRHELVAAVGGLATGELEAGAGRGGAPPPAGGLRRRPLPLPARAAARGGARRPAAGGAGAAARVDRRLPGRDARARARRPSGPTTPGRATTCPAPSAPRSRRRWTPARSARRPSSCSTWRRRSRCGRPCPTPRSGPAATRRRCCWRPPPPRARWGSCTGRWRCCAPALEVLGPDADPVGAGAGALHAGPGDGAGRGRRPARTARAPRRWRSCRPSRRRRCAPGRRPRTRG